MCVVGGRVKNWYFSLKDSEGGGISEIKIQKKQFGNNNNSVPKSKFEKGGVLRWSLRKKNQIQRHTLYRLDTVVLKLSRKHTKNLFTEKKKKKKKKKKRHHIPDYPAFQQFYHGNEWTC